MRKVLIISHSPQSVQALSELLTDEENTQISVSENATVARKMVKQNRYDLICINAPLSDETGVELTASVARSTDSCVVIIVPQKSFESISSVLIPHGVLVVSKPINKQSFQHYIKFSECFRERILRFSEDSEKLKNIVEDMKIINRAKCLLISCLNMSEQQAHRYIEKQAMDLRISKYQIAKQVIKTYEN